MGLYQTLTINYEDRLTDNLKKGIKVVTIWNNNEHEFVLNNVYRKYLIIPKEKKILLFT